MRMLGYFKEGTDVVTSYSFEIVRRPNDRLSWRFVEFRDDRRRVLAHADRDYRDKERAEKAICVIKKEASEADVFDATGATDDFDLPMRSFEITPYAVSESTVPRAVRGERLRLPDGRVVALGLLFGKSVAARAEQVS
jgi:uncharacterized protein YegP (UPF0339 family)